MTCVSEDLEKECRATMFHDNMDLARLMLHAQQVEESRWRKRRREGKNPRPSDPSGSSIGRSSFGVVDRPKFKKGHQHLGILLLPGSLIPKGTSLTPRMEMIEIPSMTESHVVSLVVCMGESAWQVVMPSVGAQQWEYDQGLPICEE